MTTAIATIGRSSERSRDRALLPPGRHFGRSVADSTGEITVTAYEPAERLATHEHATSHLCMVLSGSFLQTAAGSEHVLRPGFLGAYPVGHRHENEFGTGGAFCINWRLSGDLVPDDFGMLAVRPELQLATEQLAGCIALGGNPDRLGVEALVAELLAGGEPPESPSQFPLRRLLQAIDDQPGSSLGTLSERVGRHPTHVARAFRNATGVSIGHYRRRNRIRRLCVDLRTDSASLCDLAARHGFSDQAHMTREFKRFTGHSPGAWRMTR